MAKRRALHEVVLDAWTALSHKAPLKDEERAAGRGLFAQSWLSPKESRRLNAYMVLTAYEANASRHFIDSPDGEPGENREYGDAALIVDQVLAALLGETQEIVVPGAEDYDPRLEDELNAALAGDEDEDVEGEEPRPRELSEEDLDRLAANREAAVLAERQQFLRDWADGVHLELRMADCERNAVHLGDGVYLLGWDAKHNRVTAAVMDPGSYFPVLPDTIDTYDYPERVHFAWELDGEDFPDGKQRLRRITYSVEPIRWEPVLDRSGQVVDMVAPQDTKIVSAGEDDFGHLERVYPWSDEPSRYACYLTDATWKLDDVKDPNSVDQLTYEHASFATDDDGAVIRDYDLGFDFLPVIHIPNTPAGGHHFGQSSLARVVQLLDDIQGADTDAQRASSTSGSPMVVIHGANAPGGDKQNPRDIRALDAESRGVGDVDHQNLEAGDVIFLPGAGGATVIDTSQQLAELRNFVQSLLERLSVNSRLPAAVLGRMKPNEAPSGYAIQLSFGPLTAMIRQMRLPRGVKHPLMLKMVQRIYQVNGVLDAGPTPRAEIRLGSYLPSDMAGTLKLVVDAIKENLISLETGIAMLVDVGFPIEDIAEEIKRIEKRDFVGANELADATGDVNAVMEYLGRDPVPASEVPPPNITPPTPTNLS